MRLSVEHRLHYQFDKKHARSVHLLRVTPTDHTGQTVIDWRIDVGCDARLRHRHDGFGNTVTMLYLEHPSTTLSLTLRGEILTEDRGGVVTSLPEPLPPLFYTRSTASTFCCSLVKDLARAVGGSDPLERVHALNSLVADTLHITGNLSVQSRSMAEVLASGSATTLDAANLLVSFSRAGNVPARVVAGFKHPQRHDLKDQGLHYWAEVHVARLGWVGLDPVAGRSPDDSYVRVAVGLDANAAAPMAGARADSLPTKHGADAFDRAVQRRTA